MSEWFKKHHRVLVYPPGAGGEYIVSTLDGDNYQSVNNQNKYVSGKSFPGFVALQTEAEKLPEQHGEWTPECRLNFSNEIELKNFVKEKTLKIPHNPDLEEESIGFPVAHYKTGNLSSTMKPVWYPVHYDFNIFRAPVWWWLDYDDIYWNVHWTLCLKIKNENNIGESIEYDLQPLFKLFDIDNVHNWNHNNRNIYRNYYNQKHPKSRISVDNEYFREETNYIEWAEKNLKIIKPFADRFRTTGNGKVLWEYLNDAMPR